MKNKNVRYFAVPLLCMLLASAVQAQTATKEALYVRSLAATCANCHGTDGRAVNGSSVPTIAGLECLELGDQVFKAGTRPATVMHQLSKGYSDAQIEQISTLLGLGACATTSIPTKAKVVVVGGGYGGATAAKYVRLLSDYKIDVVLIEPNEAFIS
eukprot:gene44825-54823_t